MERNRVIIARAAFDAGARPEASGQAYIQWLGQAGFLVSTTSARIIIDPYLSDSLRIKYPDSKYSHERMSPPPVSPERLREIDLVLCTHSHGDHLDPGTIRPVAANCPSCRFIVPAAEEAAALGSGVPKARLIPAVAGGRIEALPGLLVDPIPAAHEELSTDSLGRHHFLGYLISIEGFAIYHSGDCVPYPGLAERLSAQALDLALLPVNGRDPVLKANGVIGNFFLEEAVKLTREAGIGAAIAHHFGLFAFNTIDPVKAKAELAEKDLEILGRFHFAEEGLRYELRRPRLTIPHDCDTL